MNWIEVRVATSPEAAEAVDNLLFEAGASGVVEAAPGVRVAYLPAGAESEVRIGRLRRAVGELGRFGLDPGPAEVTQRKVAESDWAHAWKEYFHPTRVGERLVVRPTWRAYTPAPGEIVLDLDPGMAFGTGTHPTTRLCARALERHVRPGASVVDVGTGSGILAIAAARLGAERVTACDTDPVAVRVARENAEKNGVAHLVEVVSGSWPQLIKAGVRADVVVANIVASVIEALIPEARALLKPQGILIASGIVGIYEAGIADAFRRDGWAVRAVHREEDWVAMEAAPAARRGGAR